MGEDSIRGKLGNSRIGVAITAYIRPLNHLTLKPYSCPILPVAPLSTSVPFSLSRSCLWDLVRLEELDHSASSLRSPGLEVDKLRPLLSQHLNTHRKDWTHYLLYLEQALVVLILQRASRLWVYVHLQYECAPKRAVRRTHISISHWF